MSHGVEASFLHVQAQFRASTLGGQWTEVMFWPLRTKNSADLHLENGPLAGEGASTAQRSVDRLRTVGNTPRVTREDVETLYLCTERTKPRILDRPETRHRMEDSPWTSSLADEEPAATPDLNLLMMLVITASSSIAEKHCNYSGLPCVLFYNSIERWRVGGSLACGVSLERVSD